MNRCRSALTMIELLVVLGVMAMLMGISTPVLLRVAQRDRLAQAADRILEVHRHARALALRYQSATQAEIDLLGAVQTGDSALGVAVVTDSGRTYATLIFGRTVDAAELQVTDADSGAVQPLLRRTLPPSCEVVVDGTPLSGRIAWFYTWVSGEVIAAPGLLQPCDVGVGPRAAVPASGAWTTEVANTAGLHLNFREYFSPALPADPGSPICAALEVRNRGGRLRSAIALYRTGNGLITVVE